MWGLDKPISQYFVAFEFETSTDIRNTIPNLMKVISLQPQRYPRFLVQIYKGKLKDKDLLYLEDIISKLPVATKIIDNVGDDPEVAAKNVLIKLFNWISMYSNIQDEFMNRLKKIIPRDKMIRILHYGEGAPNHLIYLDNALFYTFYDKDKLMWLKSIWHKEEKLSKLLKMDDAKDLDIVIISDYSIKNGEIKQLRKYIEEYVFKKGKNLIITGGVGLTRKYNELGNEVLGGSIKSNFPKKVKIKENKSNIGVGLEFGGYNSFKPKDQEEVIAYWDNGEPALIVHKYGKGQIIIFTSDCSPSWGTPSIKKDEFKIMWRQLIEKYISKNDQ